MQDTTELRALLATLTRTIAATKGSPRTDEIRDFIHEHEHVPEFVSLALTLISLCEEPIPSRGGCL